MLYLRLLYSVLFPAIAGTCFVNLFLHKKEDATFLERIALGFCMGLMLITLEMFYVLSRLNIKFSLLSISLPLVPVILAGIFVTVKNKLIDLRLPRIPNLSKFEIFLLIMILFQVFFIFSSQMIKPVTGWDAWSLYSLYGKAYFLEGTSSVPALPPMIQRQHTALSQTWIFTCIGQWNEIFGKLNFAFYYISLIVLFYCAARRSIPRMPALLSTYFLCTLPFLVHHATLEYSDFMISIYLFIAVSLLFLWFNNKELRILALSFICLLSTLTIKKESFFHIAIILIIFAFTVFSRKFKMNAEIKLVRYATVISIFVGGLFMIIRFLILPYEGMKLVSTIDFSRIWPIITVFYDYLFIRDNWNIIWFVLLLLIVFNYNRLRIGFNLNLFGLVALELFGFMIYYFLSDQATYSWLFFVTPAVRNMLQFMPVAIFFMANILTLEMPEFSVSKASLNINKDRPDNKQMRKK